MMPRSRCRRAACRTPGRRRRRGARRRRRRRPPPGRGARAASPAGTAPCFRPRDARASRASPGPRTAPRARARARPGARRRRCASRDLGEEHLERARRARQRAQHVEAHDVARALPDRGERRLAVEARHARLLDVAVAAEALQRLERVVGGALARPVLADGRRQALEQLRVGVVLARLRIACAPRRRRAPGASPARSPPRTRGTGRRARCASAAGRSAPCRRRWRWAAWWVAPTTPGASPPPRRSRSRGACARPSR